MAVYLVRRERCIPYEMAVEAASEEEAEEAAFRASDDLWNVGPAYWQDLTTEETDEDPVLSALEEEPDDTQEEIERGAS